MTDVDQIIMNYDYFLFGCSLNLKSHKIIRIFADLRGIVLDLRDIININSGPIIFRKKIGPVLIYNTFTTVKNRGVESIDNLLKDIEHG